MTLDNVLALAKKLGANVTFHEPSNTDQVDGHRWDRWYELRNRRAVPDLVIMVKGTRTSQVCREVTYA